MTRLLDPATTVAVILGAHDWTRAGQPKALSFRRSAAQWHAYLLTPAPSGLGLQPDLVLNLFDDPSPASAQLVRIRDTIKGFAREREEMGMPIRDALIYYIGHGSGSGGHLHLLVRDTAEGIEEQSSIAASDLAQVLRVAAPKQRRLIILDCCFSEAAVEAFGAMGTLDEAVATTALKDLEPGFAPPERGTLVLCSSPRRRASIGAPNAERTLFTGALLSVLAEGSARRSDMMSFGELREDIYERMLRDYNGDPPRPALHQPDQQAGDLTRLPAFPNIAVQQAERARKAAREEERQRKTAEEAHRLRAEEEQQQRDAEAAQQRTEEERRRQVAEQARMATGEEERKRKAVEEAQRLRAKEEERQAAAERQAEARRQSAAERAAEEARRKAEEAEKVRRADEARRKTEETEKVRLAEEARRKAEEAEKIRQAEETMRKAEETEKFRAAGASKRPPEKKTMGTAKYIMWSLLGSMVGPAVFDVLVRNVPEGHDPDGVDWFMIVMIFAACMIVRLIKSNR